MTRKKASTTPKQTKIIVQKGKSPVKVVIKHRKLITPSIAACFARRSKQTPLSPISPEYITPSCSSAIEMTDKGEKSLKRQTRHSSKHNGEQEPLHKQEEESENEPEVHTGLLPCPAQLDVDSEEFQKLTENQQMGNIISVLNSLCAKVTEIDININHDTDGIDTRLTTATELAENNNTSINYGATKLTQLTSTLAQTNKDLAQAKRT